MARNKSRAKRRNVSPINSNFTSTTSSQQSDFGEKYASWYDRNKNNPIIWLTDFLFNNFVFLPSEKSQFMGLVRFFTYLGILFFDPFDMDVSKSGWNVLLILFCFGQLLIALMQFVGMQFGNEDEDGHVSIGRVSEPDYSDMSDKELLNQFPGIKSWFNTRETYLRGMSASEQAKFFVETGGMTTGSVRDMAEFPSTKRALQRLDFELKRPAKEQVEYMRGKTKK